jgi:hypothetical protein
MEVFDLAEPAFALGFGDAGGEDAADLFQACSLRWVWSQEVCTGCVGGSLTPHSVLRKALMRWFVLHLATSTGR